MATSQFHHVQDCNKRVPEKPKKNDLESQSECCFAASLQVWRRHKALSCPQCPCLQGLGVYGLHGSPKNGWSPCLLPFNYQPKGRRMQGRRADAVKGEWSTHEPCRGLHVLDMYPWRRLQFCGHHAVSECIPVAMSSETTLSMTGLFALPGLCWERS